MKKLFLGFLLAIILMFLFAYKGTIFNLIYSPLQKPVLVSAYVEMSGVHSVIRQDGSWITHPPIDEATGNSRLTLVSGFFSAAPNCTVTAVSTEDDNITFKEAPTASEVWVRNRRAGTATDIPFMVTCIGMR